MTEGHKTSEIGTIAGRMRLTHYVRDDLEGIRSTLLDVYAEIYSAEIASDPFFSLDSFAERLKGHTAAPGWECVMGEIANDIVGYAYGFTLRPGSWWGDLTTPVAEEDIQESGTRTFGLAEIMVREAWRKKGISRLIHESLVSARTEERTALLVERAHPKVRHLYEQWGYRFLGVLQPFPNSPQYDAMILSLGP